MKYRDVVFDCVHLLYYKSHKIKSESWRLIDTLSLLQKNNKKATNHTNEDYNKCFQYAVTLALNK